VATHEPARSTRRRARPVLWWAAFGIAAVQVCAYLGCIFFSDFSPIGIGIDDVPSEGLSNGSWFRS
jgi:hypothetical protein